MKQNKFLMPGAAVLVLAVAGIIFLLPQIQQNKPADLIVKSDDGLAVLKIAPDALPEGLTIDEISIKKKDVAPAEEGVIVPSLLYEFSPDGTHFTKPVTLEITEQISEKAFPLMFRMEGNKVDFIYDAITKVNLAAKTRTTVAAISDFSFYGTIEGIFTVGLGVVGERAVGSTFDVPFSISWRPGPQRYNFSFGDSKTVAFTRTQAVKPNPIVTGYWESLVVYDPRNKVDAPRTVAMPENPYRYTERFTCIQKGDGRIITQIRMQYQLHVSEDDGKPADVDLNFERGGIDLESEGKCSLPEVKLTQLQTTCGGSVIITGTIGKLYSEPLRIVDILITGPGGSNFLTAQYDPATGVYRATQELMPADYTYSVSLVMGRADYHHGTDVQGNFTISPCANAETEQTALDPGGNAEATTEIVALVIDGVTYPRMQFHISRPDACKYRHWHSNGGGEVYSIDLAPLKDPAPRACGYGTVDELKEQNVKVLQKKMAEFLKYVENLGF